MTTPRSDIHIRPLSSQVGGHPGILTTEDDELLIKSALSRELEFYQRLQADEGLSSLRPFIPKFFGTLRLEGELDKTEEGIAVKPSSDSDRKDKCLFHFHFSFFIFLSFEANNGYFQYSH